MSESSSVTVVEITSCPGMEWRGQQDLHVTLVGNGGASPGMRLKPAEFQFNHHPSSPKTPNSRNLTDAHSPRSSIKARNAPSSPQVGFIVTHSTLELPCKSAHRANNHKGVDQDELEEDEPIPEFFSDYDAYEAYVEKFEEVDLSSDQDDCCSNCENWQPDQSVAKYLENDDWCEDSDWECCDEFWGPDDDDDDDGCSECYCEDWGNSDFDGDDFDEEDFEDDVEE